MKSKFKLKYADPSFSSVSSVLSPFRHFIVRFLSCGECAANFAKEADKHNLAAAEKTGELGV